MWSKEAIAQLDKYYPPAGECWICGFKDKRHRLWDAFLDTSDPDEVIASAFNVSVEYVKLVRQIRPFHRGGWISLTSKELLKL